jgi:hypothetical protein
VVEENWRRRRDGVRIARVVLVRESMVSDVYCGKVAVVIIVLMSLMMHDVVHVLDLPRRILGTRFRADVGASLSKASRNDFTSCAGARCYNVLSFPSIMLVDGLSDSSWSDQVVEKRAYETAITVTCFSVHIGKPGSFTQDCP